MSCSTNEGVWPGCPGTTARLLQWTDNLGAVFTNWDGDLSTPTGTVPDPYFAGYGLWPTTTVRTIDGASPPTTRRTWRRLTIGALTAGVSCSTP